MKSITLELAPYFMIDIIYTINRNKLVKVISGAINGLNIKLTEEQRDFIQEEILYTLEADEIDDTGDEFYFYEQN
jgi:hypothetical protein